MLPTKRNFHPPSVGSSNTDYSRYSFSDYCSNGFCKHTNAVYGMYKVTYHTNTEVVPPHCRDATPEPQEGMTGSRSSLRANLWSSSSALEKLKLCASRHKFYVAILQTKEYTPLPEIIFNRTRVRPHVSLLGLFLVYLNGAQSVRDSLCECFPRQSAVTEGICSCGA